MPESKKRKPKPKQTTGSTPPPKKEQSLNKILRFLANHPIGVLISLAETLLGAVEIIRQAIVYPEISADSAPDPSQPFATHFYVKNNSGWFDMRHVEFYCGVDAIDTASGGGFKNLSFLDWKTADIAPNAIAGYRCLLGDGPGNIVTNVKPGDVTAAHIFVRVEYRILFWERHSPPTEFTWFTKVSPPRWVKGKLVD
jgi:hypothetical protein